LEQENWLGITEGDIDTWANFLSQGIPLLYGVFVKRGWLAPMAEDLVQKTVFDAIKGRETYDPAKGSPENWFLAIGRNNMALEIRQQASRPTIENDVFTYIQAIDTKPLPDEILERKEMADIVRKALGKLDLKEQSVLTDKYIRDLSAQEIAQEMGLTEKAVYNLLYRAKASLRQGLKKLAFLDKEPS